MELLDFEKINELLAKVEINESKGIIDQKQIEEITKRIDLKPSEEFGVGKCLPNAFSVAKIIKANIVEGIAYVQVRRDEVLSETIIKHAWNVIDGKHFDVTKDHVWPNLNVSLDKSEYYIVNVFSADDYVIKDGIIEFKSNSALIASSLKYLQTKKNVLHSLNSLGLESELQEQLLKECISILKEK